MQPKRTFFTLYYLPSLIKWFTSTNPHFYNISILWQITTRNFYDFKKQAFCLPYFDQRSHFMIILTRLTSELFVSLEYIYYAASVRNTKLFHQLKEKSENNSMAFYFPSVEWFGRQKSWATIKLFSMKKGIFSFTFLFFCLLVRSIIKSGLSVLFSL